MTSDPLALRNKVKIAIAALLVVDIAAVVLLFSPLVGSERSRREQLDAIVGGAAAQDA
jgi:hypothetical protein